MGESAGAAALALALALIGGALVVMGMRGTYRDVWAAAKAPASSSSSSSPGTPALGGGGTSHVVK